MTFAGDVRGGDPLSTLYTQSAHSANYLQAGGPRPLKSLIIELSTYVPDASMLISYQ